MKILQAMRGRFWHKALNKISEHNPLIFFRSLLFFIGYVILTVSYGTVSLLSWLLPARLRHRLIASWTEVIILWLWLSCGVRYRVQGRENIDRNDGASVILSKHQSSWETLFLQSLFWPASTVLKRELLRIPFFGWGLRALSPIPIDRSNPRAALKQVKSEGLKRLANGMNLILFPEGTRMAPGEKGTYARSGADIAKTAGVDIIPVAVNSGVCWPTRGIRKQPGMITVSVGPPVLTQDRASRDIMTEVEAWIENEMKQIENLPIGNPHGKN